MQPVFRDLDPAFESDCRNLGYLDPPKRCNLTGRIHPVLSKFRGPKTIRAFTGSDSEYERIIPALRLASNYLSSPGSRVFICSLVYAERKVTGLKDIRGFPLLQFEKLDSRLCSRDRVSRIWTQLALHTEFGPREMNNARDFDVIGMTSTRIDDDGVDLRGDGKMCWASKMSFNYRFLEDIEDLHSKGKAVSKRMLNVQFHLAMNLCHEVAHAVAMATKTKNLCPRSGLYLSTPPEPFFGNETIAELGFAFVNEILGCRLSNYRWGLPGSMPTLIDWPDGGKYFDRSIPQRGPKKRTPEVNFLVDMKFVQKLFRQDFWDRLADLPTDNDKIQALRMSKAVGFIWARYLPKNWTKLSKEEAEKASRILPMRLFRDHEPASGLI